MLINNRRSFNKFQPPRSAQILYHQIDGSSNKHLLSLIQLTCRRGRKPEPCSNNSRPLFPLVYFQPPRDTFILCFIDLRERGTNTEWNTILRFIFNTLEFQDFITIGDTIEIRLNSKLGERTRRPPSASSNFREPLHYSKPPGRVTVKFL